MKDETLSGVPVSEQQPEGADERQRRRGEDHERGREAPELRHQHREDQRARRSRAPASSSGTRPAGSRRARRCGRSSRPARGRREAPPATSRTPLPRSRPSSRAVTGTICLRSSRKSCVSPCASSIVDGRREGHDLARGRGQRELADPVEVEAPARRGTAPARRSGGRRGGTRWPPGRAGPPRAASPPASTVKPTRAARVGSMRTSTSGLPRWGTTRSTRPGIFFRRSAVRAASCRELGEVVAEDLDLDRLRVPLEVAQHVLQELDELDRHARHLLREHRALLLDDLLGAGACAPTAA